MSATRANDLPIEPASAEREDWAVTNLECAHCGWLRAHAHPSGTEIDTDLCHCGTDIWHLFEEPRRDWRNLH